MKEADFLLHIVAEGENETLLKFCIFGGGKMLLIFRFLVYFGNNRIEMRLL